MKNLQQLFLNKQSLSKLIAFVCLAIISFSSKAQNYCTPTWQYNSDGNMITQVTFGNINQTSPFTSGVTPSYEDFTAQAATVEKGQNYSISIKGPSSTFPSDVVVFIDFNQNGSYDDAGESFYIGRLQAANPANAFTISDDIIIPTTALTGNTRMRILKNSNISGLSNPNAPNSITSACGSYRAGQVEDYTLNIIDLNVVVDDVVISTANNVPALITSLNGTLLLTASVLPVATAPQDVIWTIENGNSITIDQNGLVTAINNGTATVRASSLVDISKFDEIEITVDISQAPVELTVVVSTLNNITPEITVSNGDLQMIATVTNEATSTAVIWTVQQGANIVSVDANGFVTALANGTATIRATSVEDYLKFDEMDILVNFPINVVTDVMISVLNNGAPEITVVNGTLQLLATVNPSVVSQDVTWSITSGNQFISINPLGVVTAIGNGTAVVRATSVVDNTKYDELAVTVAINYAGLETISDFVSLSPNPTSDVIYISLGGKVLTSKVTIMDLRGKQILMKEFTTSDFSIDLSDLSLGVYNLIVQTDNGLVSSKIIKN